MVKRTQGTVSKPDFTRVVRAVICPGIGIARLGNSLEADGFFIGPETTGFAMGDSGGIRDATGAIKRQAARFRIYGYDADGKVVGEITAEQAQIDWQVHLVNRKAQWFKFDMAMDIPEAVDVEVPLRNPHVTGDARKALAIDPGPRSIGGKSLSGKDFHFDSADFMGVKVPLGELRTDAHGRLLVLGGFARSGSPSGKPIYAPDEPYAFPNAAEWFDDTSDGPVSAKVMLGGKSLPVESAWVVAAQPGFAPDVVGWRTLYDLLMDTYRACGWIESVQSVSFQRDILPSLQRLSGLQWVNKGFASMFGHGAPLDFGNPQLIARLARNDETYSHLRRSVFNAFRAADNSVHEQRTWPWIYGDTFGADQYLPGDHLSPSAQRGDLLRRWAKGDFVNDWVADAEPVRSINDLPVAEQPGMLDQAALHFCVADAFHPGIELSWPMRHASIYRAPFRIKEAPVDEPLPDYGASLGQKAALASDGPLHAQPPGGLSRWMALPWQIDTVGCRSGYDADYDPYLPTFWPAQIPNQVLSEADYNVVMDATLPLEQRQASFNTRLRWGRQVAGGFIEQAMQVVSDVGILGVVEARPGIAGDEDFPQVMQVEIEHEANPKTGLGSSAVGSGLGPQVQAVQHLLDAGWESAEQYEEFRRILRV